MQADPPPHRPPTPTWLTWFCYKVYYPFSTVRSIYLTAFAFAIFFLILAIVQISVYSSGFEHKVLYSQGSKCLVKSTDQRCEVTLELQETLQPPILFMYLMENAYINHRKYIDSVSTDQLAGKTIDADTAQKSCTPFVYNTDLGVNKSYTGTPLVPDFVASPCGFTAALTFNDTYSLYDSKGAKIPISQSNITLKLNDYESFKRQTFSDHDQWIDPIDGHFINWMKNQALITKYKLWGKIEQPLEKGNYSVVVENNYHIGELRIKKGIEIVVPTAFGGQIYFFPIIYMLMFTICTAYGILVYHKLRLYDELVQQEIDAIQRQKELQRKQKY